MSTRPSNLIRPAALLPLLALAACASPPPPVDQAPLYQAQDVVADGVFRSGIEGPATGPDGALYAVSYQRDGTIGRIPLAGPDAGQPALFVELPAGSTGNGIRFDPDGRMYVADYSGHQILRVDTLTRAVDVFARLPDAHQPNDIARAPDGTLYASDPDWKNGDGQLWKIDALGEVTLLEDGMGTTNGVEVSPDGKQLYVNESVQRNVWRYDIGHDGGLSNKKLMIHFAEHGLDGMRTDVRGNLYVARYDAGTVAILSPAGDLLRQVELKGRKPTNVAFGGADGRTVFVTLQDRGAIESFRSEFPGREYGWPAD